MKTQSDILRHAVDAFERLGIEYMIVGSQASIAFGEVRFTQDIDIVANLNRLHVDALMLAFPAPEFYCNRSAIETAIQSHVPFNIIHPASGNKLDIMLPRRDSWGIARMKRRRAMPLLPDRDVFVAAPEDIIIGKLWYYSEGGGDRHLRDIASMLRISGELIDRKEVEYWARELGYLEIWNEVVRVADGPDPKPR